MTPSARLLRALSVLDRISDASGRAAAWLIVPMVMALVWEVVARYGFAKPTVWAYDITYMTYGSLYMLGAAYTLLRGDHIRTDNFYGTWSIRRQGLVDAIGYVVFFFPPLIVLLILSWDYFAVSLMRGERNVSSPWMPPIYPLKGVIPLTCLLLLLQGSAEFVRSLWAARYGVKLPRLGEASAS
jgi:TRAP-type mannitol/chloroaromatic compound transport system permease small subunit